MSDILFDICVHYFMITENPQIQWWINDKTIADAEEGIDQREATESIKFCNLDHYFKTEGWTK